MSVIDRDRGWGDLKRLADKLKEAPTVKVGYLSDRHEERKPSPGEKGEPPTNLKVAAWMELGTRRAPPRPFLSSTFDAKREEYRALVEQLTRAILAGKLTPERALGLIGAKVSADVKNRVTTGAQIPPPNAPSTLARKRAKGEGDPRTLVDTGQMVGALTWALDKGGGGDE